MAGRVDVLLLAAVVLAVVTGCGGGVKEPVKTPLSGSWKAAPDTPLTGSTTQARMADAQIGFNPTTSQAWPSQDQGGTCDVATFMDWSGSGGSTMEQFEGTYTQTGDTITANCSAKVEVGSSQAAGDWVQLDLTIADSTHVNGTIAYRHDGEDYSGTIALTPYGH